MRRRSPACSLVPVPVALARASGEPQWVVCGRIELRWPLAATGARVRRVASGAAALLEGLARSARGHARKRGVNLPLPPLDAVLTRPRREALDAFLGAGWRPYARPLSLDAERRRILNIDLSEPEVGLEREGDLVAVAHVETDREGLVTHVEVVGARPEDPVAVALALLGEIGPPRSGGGVAAREWVWGPESGATAAIGGEPVRLWICAERAYGDRLWLVASIVRRA